MQSPSQLQHLTQLQLQSVELLQMSTAELEAYIQELALSNPLVEPETTFPAPEPAREPAREAERRLRFLEENDRQDRFYRDTLDPLTLVGTGGGLEETLFRSLSRQIQRLDLPADTAQAVRYLAACLDDSGYLRISLEELAEELGAPLPLLEEALAILRSLDPPGVGAADLSECLALQLERRQETGPALAIVRDCLEPLARRHYRHIAERLGISPEEVEAAAALIRSLEPRPGAVFQRPEQAQYLLPDVFVEERDGQLTVRTRRGDRPAFRISSYYRDLLLHTEEKETREYLTAKLRHAENILWAIGQRESTLLRCAQAIVRRQSAFFRRGPGALLPLRLIDVARELGVHESTVSRTVHEKYLQCSRGVYPMSYFFSRATTAEGGMSRTAARVLLRQLIDAEDKRHPLSDQKLAERMAQNGCPLSRRTVAKYREEMEIPGASGRKMQA